MLSRIQVDMPYVVRFLTFSPDGRYLAATLSRGGLRVFDRDENWDETFRDVYDDDSLGAAFARDGRLATTSFDSGGTIRLYDPNFRLVGKPIEAPSGRHPRRIVFSPDGGLLAVAYLETAGVDLFDGRSLNRVPGPSPTNVDTRQGGLEDVAWSRDGRMLFAGGGVNDMAGRRVLLAWDNGGIGNERRWTYCAEDLVAGIETLPDGRVLVASMRPCLGLMNPEGEPIWTNKSPIGDFRGQDDQLKVSEDGNVVDFGDVGGTKLRFDVRSLRLGDELSIDGITFAPWRNGFSKAIGEATPIGPNNPTRSFAITQDGKRFFVGSSYGLVVFDNTAAVKWQRNSRGEVWAVNVSKDGRILVAAYGDGTIRWHRADDGRELLALQVLANKTDWVLWTPEGFYEATPGAEDVLKWVVNHGPDKPATTLPISAIPWLHRPDALRLVLDELATKGALGAADLARARLAVQAATGSAKPPGGVLHILAIGVDKFGDKAGGLHLDFAAEDAREVASVLLESQKIAPGKPSLYAGVSMEYLPNEKADRRSILEAMGRMADAMGKGGPDQDIAVILFSSHGEMIEGQFYLVPYGFDAGTPTAMETSAVSAEEFAKKVKILAGKGRVLLLLDACHSGAIGPGADLDPSVLRSAVNMDNVTVLTSASKKGELSQELPAWGHGAFTQAFLDALSGGADPENHGVISMSDLASAMDKDLAL